ncbi:hypothetical protein OG901_50380 [Streptomyces mirabilis]|uniref:hypothetical protein n=1 Tax=Streptomyces mirabilis TaxID=68239 RepID=UPI00224E457A|nr:hypothetical protein [Streptomyces mirabilis]MCX5355759.1 hypothetical protein [Streptomyces mirabilis]
MQQRVVQPHVELQRDLRELQSLIAQVSHSVEGAVEGAWSEAYARAMATFGTGAGADQIKALTDTAEQLARYGEKTRADAAYYKNMIVIQLNLFLVEWSLIMAMAVWNPFGALAEQAVLRATYRAILRSLIFRFLVGLAAQEVLNVGLAAATHEFAKWLTQEQGYTLEDSDALLKQAVGFGALQGVFGAFVPFVGGALGGLLGKAFGRDAAGAVRGAVDAALADAQRVKAAGRDVAGEVTGSGVKPVAADFGRDLAERTVNLARVLGEGRAGAVSDGLFADIGKVFERYLGGVMGAGAARRLGEDWAREFAGSFGSRRMEAALAEPLRGLPKHLDGLRGALSREVARVFAPDFGRKVASLAGEAVLWGGAMNLAEGTYNAITTGRFTTSLATFTSGAFGALIGHAGAHLGGKAGWKLRSALGLGRPSTVSGAGAGGTDAGTGAGAVNALPGPDHPLMRPAADLRFTPPRTVSDGLPSYYPSHPHAQTPSPTRAGGHTSTYPRTAPQPGTHPAAVPGSPPTETAAGRHHPSPNPGAHTDTATHADTAAHAGADLPGSPAAHRAATAGTGAADAGKDTAAGSGTAWNALPAADHPLNQPVPAFPPGLTVPKAPLPTWSGGVPSPTPGDRSPGSAGTSPSPADLTAGPHGLRAADTPTGPATTTGPETQGEPAARRTAQEPADDGRPAWSREGRAENVRGGLPAVLLDDNADLADLSPAGASEGAAGHRTVGAPLSLAGEASGWQPALQAHAVAATQDGTAAQSGRAAAPQPGTDTAPRGTATAEREDGAQPADTHPEEETPADSPASRETLARLSGTNVPHAVPEAHPVLDAPSAPTVVPVSFRIQARQAAASLDHMATEIGVPESVREEHVRQVRQAAEAAEGAEQPTRAVAAFRDAIRIHDVNGRYRSFTRHAHEGPDRLAPLGLDRAEWQQRVNEVEAARRRLDHDALDEALRDYTALIERHVPLEALEGADAPLYHDPELARLRRQAEQAPGEGATRAHAEFLHAQAFSDRLRQRLDEVAAAGGQDLQEAVLRQRLRTADTPERAEAAERDLDAFLAGEEMRRRLTQLDAGAENATEILQRRLEALRDPTETPDEQELELRRRLDDAENDAERAQLQQVLHEHREIRRLRDRIADLERGEDEPAGEAVTEEELLRRYTALVQDETGQAAELRQEALQARTEELAGEKLKQIQKAQDAEEAGRRQDVAHLRRLLEEAEADYHAEQVARLQDLDVPRTDPDSAPDHHRPDDGPSEGVGDAPSGRPADAAWVNPSADTTPGRERKPPAIERVRHLRAELAGKLTPTERLAPLHDEILSALSQPRMEKAGHLHRITDNALEAAAAQAGSDAATALEDRLTRLPATPIGRPDDSPVSSGDDAPDPQPRNTEEPPQADVPPVPAHADDSTTAMATPDDDLGADRGDEEQTETDRSADDDLARWLRNLSTPDDDITGAPSDSPRDRSEASAIGELTVTLPRAVAEPETRPDDLAAIDATTLPEPPQAADLDGLRRLTGAGTPRESRSALSPPSRTDAATSGHPDVASADAAVQRPAGSFPATTTGLMAGTVESDAHAEEAAAPSASTSSNVARRKGKARETWSWVAPAGNSAAYRVSNTGMVDLGDVTVPAGPWVPAYGNVFVLASEGDVYVLDGSTGAIDVGGAEALSGAGPDLDSDDRFAYHLEMSGNGLLLRSPSGTHPLPGRVTTSDEPASQGTEMDPEHLKQLARELGRPVKEARRLLEEAARMLAPRPVIADDSASRALLGEVHRALFDVVLVLDRDGRAGAGQTVERILGHKPYLRSSMTGLPAGAPFADLSASVAGTTEQAGTSGIPRTQPATSSADTGSSRPHSEEAVVPARVARETPLPEAVRQLSDTDAAQLHGLVNLAPVPALILKALHADVAETLATVLTSDRARNAVAGAVGRLLAGTRSGSDAGADLAARLESELTQRLTSEFLVAGRRQALGESGLPVRLETLRSRGLPHRMSVRMRLGEPREAVVESRETPGGVQRWAFAVSNADRNVGTSDARTLSLSGQNAWSLPHTSWLPSVSLSGGLSLTHNQRATSLSTGVSLRSLDLQGAQGERGLPYDWDAGLEWRLTDEPASATAPSYDTGWMQANVGWRMRSWFPQHVLAPPAARTERMPVAVPLEDAMLNAPLVGLGSFFFGKYRDDVIAALGEHLADLAPASHDVVRQFLAEDSLRGGPLWLVGLHTSPMLFRRNGEPAGFLAARFTLTASEPAEDRGVRASQATVMEVDTFKTVSVSGSTSLTNAAGVSLGVSGSLFGRLGLSGHAATQQSETHGLGYGTSVLVSHGMRSYRPHLQQDAMAVPHVTLVRPDGEEVRIGPGTLPSEGYPVTLRVPSTETVGSPDQAPERPRHAPRDVREMTDPGLTVTPMNVSVQGEFFERVREAVRDFLPGPQSGGDTAQRWQRLANLRLLMEAQSTAALRDMVGSPRHLHLTRSTATGVETLLVRLSLKPRSDLVHVRDLPGVRLLSFTASWTNGAERRTDTLHSLSLGLDIGGQVPTGSRAVSGVDLGLDYSYNRSSTLTEATATVNSQENYLITPEGVAVFGGEAELVAEFHATHGAAPEPVTAAAQVRLAVAAFRTLDSPGQDGVSPPPATRALREDERRLDEGRPDEAFPLPDSAFIDRLTGSDALRAAVNGLLASFGTSNPAREAVQPEARDDEAADDLLPGLPGAFPMSARPGSDANARAGARPVSDTTPAQAERETATAEQADALERGASGVFGALRHARTVAAGPDPLDPAGLIQAALRNALSSEHMRDFMLPMLRGPVGTEYRVSANVPGLVGTDVAVTVSGYVKNPTLSRQVPAGAGLVTERWHVSGHGADVTPSRGSGHSVADPLTQAGLRLPHGYTLSGRQTHGFGGAESHTWSDGFSAYRITSQSETDTYWFTSDLVLVVRVDRGRHQWLANLLNPGSESRDIAVEVPQAVEFFVGEHELRRYPDLAARAGLTDLPPLPDPDRPLPLSYSASGGSIGLGAVTEVTVTDPAGQSPVRRALRMVEDVAPGSTTVGSHSYVPGWADRIREAAAPRGIQHLLAAGHTSVGTTVDDWLGPRHVRVSLTARPADGFERVLGRPVPAGHDLETQFVRATGAGSALPEPGSTGHSLSRNASHQVRLQVSGPLRSFGGFSAPLSDAVQDILARNGLHSDDRRVWDHTTAEHVSEFEVPYVVEIGVTTTALRHAALLLPALSPSLLYASLATVTGRIMDAYGVAAPVTRTETVDVTATLRLADTGLSLGADELPAPVAPGVRRDDPAAQTGPQPEDAVAVQVERTLAGEPWRPRGTFEVLHFDALPQIAQALREVTGQTEQRHPAPPRTLSREGLLTRLRELVRTGEHTPLGRENTAPFLGGRGLPGTSLRVQLYEPVTFAAGVHAALDDVQVSTGGQTSGVTTSTSPTVGLGLDSTVGHVGASSAVLADRPRTGQSAGGWSQYREYLRSGTTGESPDGRGGVSYQVAAVVKVTVRGPRGAVRHVLGNAYLHTLDRPRTAALNRVEFSAAADDAVRAVRRMPEAGGPAADPALRLLAELLDTVHLPVGAGTRPAALPEDTRWQPADGGRAGVEAALRGAGEGSLALVVRGLPGSADRQALAAYHAHDGRVLWHVVDAAEGARVLADDKDVLSGEAFAALFDRSGLPVRNAETTTGQVTEARPPTPRDELPTRGALPRKPSLADRPRAADDPADTVVSTVLQIMRGEDEQVPAPGAALVEEAAGPVVAAGDRAARATVPGGRVRDRKDLEALVRQARSGFRRTEASEEVSLQECLNLLYAFRDRLFPQGVRPAGTVDDSVLDVRPQEGRLAVGEGWRSVASHEAVAQALRNPGDAAFVLARRPSGKGHAWAAYRLAEELPETSPVVWVELLPVDGDPVRSLPPQVPLSEARAVVVDASGRVVPDALKPFTASWSTLHALVDPAQEHSYGAIGLEYELTREFVLPAGVRLEPGHVLARHTSGASVVFERVASLESADERLYKWPHDVPAGTSTNMFCTLIPEIVLPPMAVLQNEQRLSPAIGMNVLRNASEALRTALPGISLTGILQPENGWTVTSAGQFFTAGRFVAGVEGRSYTQFTVGVPVSSVAALHDVAREWISLHTHIPLMEAEAQFGDRLATIYAAERTGRPRSTTEIPFLTSLVAGLETVRGFGRLAFSHLLAIAVSPRFSPGELTKNSLMMASRTPFADIRFGLPRHVIEFFDRNKRTVRELVVEELWSFVSAQWAIRGSGQGDTKQGLLLTRLVVRSDLTLRDYLETIFFTVPPGEAIGQQDSVGMVDYPGLDTDDGRLRHGLLLLEMRWFGADQLLHTDREVDAAFSNLQHAARHGYEMAEVAERERLPALGVVLQHPLVSVLARLGEATRLRVLDHRTIPVPLLNGAAMRLLAESAVEFAQGAPLTDALRDTVRDLADRTGRILAMPGVPHEQELRRVIGTAQEALRYLDGAAALGTSLGRPVTTQEVGAVAAVRQMLPEQHQAHVSAAEVLEAFNHYFRPYTLQQPPSVLNGQGRQAYQAAVPRAAAVLNGRFASHTLRGAVPGAGRDAGADPVAEGWPAGGLLTPTGPRGTGGRPREMDADAVTAVVEAASDKRAQRWFTVSGPAVKVATSTRRSAFSYRVDSGGAFELPDGRVLPGGPWFAYGYDFVHRDTESGAGFLLHGGNGWLGELTNAEQVLDVASADDTAGQYRLVPTDTGLHLLPADGTGNAYRLLGVEAVMHLGGAAALPSPAATNGRAPAPEDEAGRPVSVGAGPALRLRGGAGMTAEQDDVEEDFAAAVGSDAVLADLPPWLLRQAVDIYGRVRPAELSVSADGQPAPEREQYRADLRAVAEAGLAVAEMREQSGNASSLGGDDVAADRAVVAAMTSRARHLAAERADAVGTGSGPAGAEGTSRPAGAREEQPSLDRRVEKLRRQLDAKLTDAERLAGLRAEVRTAVAERRMEQAGHLDRITQRGLEGRQDRDRDRTAALHERLSRLPQAPGGRPNTPVPSPLAPVAHDTVGDWPSDTPQLPDPETPSALERLSGRGRTGMRSVRDAGGATRRHTNSGVGGPLSAEPQSESESERLPQPNPEPDPGTGRSAPAEHPAELVEVPGLSMALSSGETPVQLQQGRRQLSGTPLVAGPSRLLGHDFRVAGPAVGPLDVASFYVARSAGPQGGFTQERVRAPWHVSTFLFPYVVLLDSVQERVRVRTADGDTDMEHAEFAQLLASHLAAQPVRPGAPIVLLLAGGGGADLTLPRLVAAWTEREVWAHSGAVGVLPDQRLSRIVLVGGVAGRPEGRWIRTLPDDLRNAVQRTYGGQVLPGQAPADWISDLTGQMIPYASVHHYTVVDHLNRPVGRASLNAVDWTRAEAAMGQHPLPLSEFYLTGRDVGDRFFVRGLPQRRLPWKRDLPDTSPYYFIAHGTENYVQLHRGRAGTASFSGTNTGRWLRRRPSLERRRPRDPIVLLACSTGGLTTAPEGNAAQQVANETGRTVYAATGKARVEFIVEDTRDGYLGEWLVFHPGRPQDRYLYAPGRRIFVPPFELQPAAAGGAGGSGAFGVSFDALEATSDEPAAQGAWQDEAHIGDPMLQAALAGPSSTARKGTVTPQRPQGADLAVPAPWQNVLDRARDAVRGMDDTERRQLRADAEDIMAAHGLDGPGPSQTGGEQGEPYGRLRDAVSRRLHEAGPAAAGTPARDLREALGPRLQHGLRGGSTDPLPTGGTDPLTDTVRQ